MPRKSRARCPIHDIRLICLSCRMSEIAKRRTPARAAAARKNGKLGGRPSFEPEDSAT